MEHNEKMGIVTADERIWWILQKLTESKLRTLFSDLQLQDKEEIQLKRIKSEGGDKAGLKEAEVRRRFKGEPVVVLRGEPVRLSVLNW